MRYEPVQREERSYQRPLAESEITAMCRRLLGPGAQPVSAVENTFGTYNSTFRVELSEGPPVYLRVAPGPLLQFRSEHEFMRNEYAGAPFLAPIAALLPRLLGVDFTHEIVDRDYLIQSELEGIHAPAGLSRFPRDQWASFFRDMGSIARSIHAVRGRGFGFVAGPDYDSWATALIASLADIAADLEGVGIDASDVHALGRQVARHRAVFDQITEPRLLHGDLWTVNVTIASEGPEPRIVGVCDADRMSWGDPHADWTIYLAQKRAGTEREAFWDSYGRRDATPEDELRADLYAARHLVMGRLEQFRLGRTEEVVDSFREVAEILDRIPD